MRLGGGVGALGSQYPGMELRISLVYLIITSYKARGPVTMAGNQIQL